MEHTWDLSFLYKGFDDPAFLADVARWPEMIAEQKAVLESDLPDREKLEQLCELDEAMSALVDRLYNFSGLTLAADASNSAAQQYEDKLALIGNDASLVSSANSFVGFFYNKRFKALYCLFSVPGAAIRCTQTLCYINQVFKRTFHNFTSLSK